MLLVHNGREWLQFESDLSFTGIVGFVQETLKYVIGVWQGRVWGGCGSCACLLLVCLAGGVKQLSQTSSATMQESLMPWVLTNQVSHSWSHGHPVAPCTSRPSRWSQASCLSSHAEESLYPPQLLEDDEVGIFVHDHKITAKLFRHFDRDPDQLRACIAAQPQSVVTFYQPCMFSGVGTCKLLL